jgi:hypothetical protein
MLNREDETEAPAAERLLTAEEIGDLLGITGRKVLMLPIKRIRIGTRIVRFRLRDVYDFIDLENSSA